MENFEIVCKRCGSKKVELDIGMAQGAGYVNFECLDCGAKDSADQDR